MKLLIIYHAGWSTDAKSIFQEYIRQGIELTVMVPTGLKFWPLFSAIKKAKPDIIHVFDEYSSLYLTQTIFCRNILYGKRVPILAYAFQNIPFKPPAFILGFSIRSFKRVAYKLVHSFIFRYHQNNVSGVTGSNTEALLNIKNVNPNVPTRLIFWGVDFKSFYAENYAASRQKIGFSPNTMVVGYVGRLVKEKGLGVLIKAAHIIKNCHVALVGSGDYEGELRKLIDSLGMQDRVNFFTNVPRQDLKNFYSSFDVFVLASETTPEWKEQYGRVLVEAMACGLPVVGSSSGAIPEVLKRYPKGFIFREGDIEDLAKKISMAENAVFPKNFDLNSFLHAFGVEHFAKEHISFYKSFLL